MYDKMEDSLHQIVTSNAPVAIGPYSQAVIAGDYLFVSGQVPIDPATGRLVRGGIHEQTLRVIDNLEAILASSGGSLTDVVKTDVFLCDMATFQEMNKVYAEKFNHAIKPARQVVEVCKLPMNASIEISCIAYLGNR